MKTKVTSEASFFVRVAFGAIAIVSAAGLGCSTTPKTTLDVSENAAASRELTLNPGDVLQVKFPYWPELNEEQAVRPDGRISLQLIGEVEVEGLTPAQLHEKLMTAYAGKLKNPELNVVTSSLGSHRVYVGGEVKNPGLVPINGRLTALEAIMQAGGYDKRSAKMSTVVIVRQREGKQYAYSVDLKKAIEQPNSDPYYLDPSDIVYVPRTAIDRVDQWVDQYINQVVPRNLQYSFNNQTTSQTTQATKATLQVPVKAAGGTIQVPVAVK
jgi:polysaccharide export outer membrane protein